LRPSPLRPSPPHRRCRNRRHPLRPSR
jgi:hypothetical protein